MFSFCPSMFLFFLFLLLSFFLWLIDRGLKEREREREREREKARRSRGITVRLQDPSVIGSPVLQPSLCRQHSRIQWELFTTSEHEIFSVVTHWKHINKIILLIYVISLLLSTLSCIVLYERCFTNTFYYYYYYNYYYICSKQMGTHFNTTKHK